MTTWKESYSRGLEHATMLYVQGDIERMERQLDIMNGMIYDDEATAELKEFIEKVDISYQQQLATIEKEAQIKSNAIEKRIVYSDIDRIVLWRLVEILRHHQYLARKYSLVPALK